MRRRSIERVEVWDHERADMRPLDEILRQLIDLPPAPMISLYLDLHWADEQQRDRVWLTVKDRARAIAAAQPELEAELREALAFTEERVKQGADVGFGGAARFLSFKLGLDLSLRTGMELPTILAPGPLVRPLVAAAQAHERAIVALANSDEVRIFELELGRLRQAAAHFGDVPNRTERGGWSQLKNQHHRQEHIDALHREAAASIARLFDEAPGRVLLGGIAEAAANLERELPKRVLADLVHIDAPSHDQPSHELQATAERAIDAAEADDERAALARVQTLACSGGRGALGLSKVIDALNESRPMRVFVPDRSQKSVQICEQCRALSLGNDGTCRVCGGSCREVDACEGLVRAAIGLGARVDVVDRATLDAVGGAAAELRY